MSNFFWSLIVGIVLFLAECTGGVLPSEEVLFSCSFKTDSCGMTNRPDSSGQWHREYLTLAGRSGYAMVVHGNEANNKFVRLLTPFLSTNGAEKGCLRFSYHIAGYKPASLAVIKQGFVTQYIFNTARKTLNAWKNAEVDVQLLGDKVMFYFEADTRVQEYGNSLVAFTDLTITAHPCQFRSYFG